MNTTNIKSKRVHSNEDSKRSPAKRQYRNENEKRRRDLFSQLITNLDDILNIDKTSALNNKLDKASILRETASFLRKHQDDLIFQTNSSSSSSNSRANELVDGTWKPSNNLITIEEWIQITIESMNCFFLVAKSDPHNAQIVYVSRNIHSLLDYSQNELLNRSLFELILSRDHDQLRDYLLKDHKTLEICNLSWRRATADEYEQCTIIGAFRQIKKKREEENDEKYLMSIVKVNTLDRILSINYDNNIHQFTTRLNLHGKFIFIDSKAREYLGYNSYELIGHTHFDFVHPDDLPIIIRAHQIWKENGNGKSDSYRFLSKGQQWIFLQTECQVQINSWTGKPESYLCTSIPLQNPNDCLQKQLSSIILSSQTSNINSLNRTTVNPILSSNSETRSSSSDPQITSFLSHLSDEKYRTNIREKLNERKCSKQAEIRIREDEIKVIEDLIRFIDEFQTKQSNKSLSSSSSTITMDLQNKTNQQDNLNEINILETNNDSKLIESPLINNIEEYSIEYSKTISHQNLSKDQIITESIINSIYSPSEQVNYSISSPMTPYSILSRPSPMTPLVLSVSPTPSPSTLIQTTSLLNTTSTIQDINSTKSSSSSSSSSTTTTTTTTTNSNTHSTEQTQKNSSFNRSLPHSLVS